MARKSKEVIEKKKVEYMKLYCPYLISYYKDWDFSIFTNIISHKRRGAKTNKNTYNDCIIMLDTETSKEKLNNKGIKRKQFYDDIIVQDTYEPVVNYIVAWTISIRAYHYNIVTLYGTRPSELVDCLDRLRKALKGDDIFIYIHNMSYDWWFIRKFMIEKFGNPERQLNVKPHYPIYIQFSNGIILKDSLILAQRKLEKWAKDMNVDHLKASGKWDYNKIRHQGEQFSKDELEYIEHDTLAGVECIDATLQLLGKNISSIPYTATGIPREQSRKAGGGKAREDFKRQVCKDYIIQQMLEQVYHGGFTHSNRKLIDILIRGLTQCYDFASSYPFSLLAYKYPMEEFFRVDDTNIARIEKLRNQDYAAIFKLCLVNVKLKAGLPMPALQKSKCVKLINPVSDNGRILEASYLEIYLTEIDLEVIADQYEYKEDYCFEVYIAQKDYLPKWFTDYIYQKFKDKTLLKGQDKVAYALAKATVNSLYGMCVQKPVKEDIVEDYDNSKYKIVTEGFDYEERYLDYIGKRGSILNYAWGVYCTAYAFRNLFELGKCCKLWIYSDTDSCYGQGWDTKKIEDYNKKCIKLLKDRGYEGITIGDKTYNLGVAEHIEGEDDYIEFKTMGAKRYCGRNVADGELHITVAGVPKSGAKCLNNDIENFTPGFIFKGNETGKKTHMYSSVDKIYINKYGDEVGDSIDLTPCDYLLDSTERIDYESLFEDEIVIQIAGLED